MRGEGFDNFGYPLFAALRERSTLFERMSALSFQPYAMSLSAGSSTELVYATLVSGTFFEVLGTRPAAGRFFLPEEDRAPGAVPVVVLSHAFWMGRFKGDPAVVGTTIALSGRPYAIVGVAEQASPAPASSTPISGCRSPWSSTFAAPMRRSCPIRARCGIWRSAV